MPSTHLAMNILLRTRYLLGSAIFGPNEPFTTGSVEESIYDPKTKTIKWNDHAIRFDCSRYQEYFRNFTPSNGVAYFEDAGVVCKIAGVHELVVSFGDREPDYDTCYAKSRYVNQQRGMLLPLNTRRHWGFSLAEAITLQPATLKARLVVDPHTWSAKKSVLFWRGSMTGSGLRGEFVQAAANFLRNQSSGIDIKFHHISSKYSEKYQLQLGQQTNQTKEVKFVDREYSLNEMLEKRKYSLKEMLENRYLLSIEGNDVASNLKWALASNSLVVMPLPTKETWLMEGLLQPYVHFVPIQHPDELLAVKTWLEQNDDLCQAIVRNANVWITDVLDDFAGPIKFMPQLLESLTNHHHTKHITNIPRHTTLA
mmetsp:Transcript_38699/g.64194  ORF Transcript_38699/g.64194 Transcript_38699/m.64194 type:complete len:368 (-) Transcript_38699:421-1524(-)